MISDPTFGLVFWMAAIAAAHLVVFFLCGLHRDRQSA